jgi:hypothetical protein
VDRKHEPRLVPGGEFVRESIRPVGRSGRSGRSERARSNVAISRAGPLQCRLSWARSVYRGGFATFEGGRAGQVGLNVARSDIEAGLPAVLRQKEWPGHSRRANPRDLRSGYRREAWKQIRGRPIPDGKRVSCRRSSPACDSVATNLVSERDARDVDGL